jgi:hypothetical protein
MSGHKPFWDSVDWPRDVYDYPENLTLSGLAKRPRFALVIVRYLLDAAREHVFIAGLTSRASFSPQRPSSFPRGSYGRKCYRFATECLLPTFFFTPKLYEVNGYFAEGFKCSVYLWILGKGWTFGAGRRGALMYEPHPPDEFDFPDYLPDDEGCEI